MKVILTEEQIKLIALNEYRTQIDAMANEAETEPTEGQKKAGNYKMGHLTFGGFKISIENPKGSKRHYRDENGKDAFNVMKNHYGYFSGTKGIDGDQVDVFLGPYEDFDTVFVVDQNKKDGSFDESKVMLGFKSESEAKKAYLSNFSANWRGFRAITGVSVDIFKKWLYSGRKQQKPFGEYSKIKNGKKKKE